MASFGIGTIFARIPVAEVTDIVLKSLFKSCSSFAGETAKTSLFYACNVKIVPFNSLKRNIYC